MLIMLFCKTYKIFIKNLNESKNTMKTHFGFQSVPRNKKASLVSDVFSKVACKYDLMNDLISFGMHRIWKKFLVHHSRVFIGSKILDLAGGTGDLSIQFSRLVGASGLVFLVDINASMLQIGRNKLRNLGIINNVMYVQADAENLPFAENIFDYVVVSFGLRNFTNKEKALFSIYRVLKSGGKLLILDFSMPTSKLLNIVYDFYSFHLIPKIGSIVAHTTSSYRYLVESIRMHSNQEVLKNMILEAGFNEVKYFNMTFGIVSLHCACKY